MMGQLSLFDVRNPTWDDVQKGSAEFVRRGRYISFCRVDCFWFSDVYENMDRVWCYLFAKPIDKGRCPSSGHIEWKDGR